MSGETRIGLISDTHGLLRPEALEALAGSDLIIHAGDVGDPAILTALAAIAPVTAVRGNVDTEDWAACLPERATLRPQEASILVLHDPDELAAAAMTGFQAVIVGHSHRPMIRDQDGVLLVNPGSAGPRRFRLPISLGWLHVSGARVSAHLFELAPGGT